MTYGMKKMTEAEIEARKQLRKDLERLVFYTRLDRVSFRRVVERKNFLHVVQRIQNAFYTCSLLELELFVRLMKNILDEHPELERSMYKHQWNYAVHMAKNHIFKKMEGIKAFYVVDRKGCTECNLHTLPTMEALIDFIAVKSGSILQLHEDLSKGRYIVIGGRRIALMQRILDIKLEVTPNL